MCCDISVSPQNALDVPAESIVFVACGGGGGSFSSSLCYPRSRAAAASHPSGVPGGCQQAGVAQGSKFCCCCSSVSGPLHLRKEGRGYSLPCNRNSACLRTFCSFSNLSEKASLQQSFCSPTRTKNAFTVARPAKHRHSSRQYGKQHKW